MKITQILFLSLINLTTPCKINGYNSGQCVEKSKIQKTLPFCENHLPKTICLSKTQNNFEIISAEKKDLMIKKIFLKNLEKKIIKDYEIENNTKMYLIKDEDCRISYQKFLCNWNIPKCDDQGNSVFPCFSICTEFARHCGYSQDICSNKLIVR